jgi:hypothetical protein
MIMESHSPARSTAGRAASWETINLALEGGGAHDAFPSPHPPRSLAKKGPHQPFLERGRVPKLEAECLNPSSPLGSKEAANGTPQEHPS